MGDKVSVIQEKATGFVVKVINQNLFEVEIDGFVLTKTKTELAKVFLEESDIVHVEEKMVDQIKPELEMKTPEHVQVFFDKRLKGNVLEIDLHFHSLIEHEYKYKPWERLNVQLDFLKDSIEYALRHRFKKLIVIHGVGAGVLKTEALKLIQSYDRLKTEDASYQKYGRGATEVLIG